MIRESTTDRLARLLALIAYLGEHDDVPVAELADHFGVSPAQVLRDVDTLWVSGTPGYQPDDLLDFSVDARDDDRIALVNARGMDRPLRLGPGEAVALIVALRALAALPGMSGPVVESALAKLVHAAGDAASSADSITVTAATPAVAGHVTDVLERAREALRGGVRLDLTYVSAADVVTERTVEPLALLSDGEHWYLRAWCLRADGERHFRLDRVLALDLTSVAVERLPEPSDAGTRPRLHEETVTLRLTSRARWVAERYQGRIVAEDAAALTVELDVADPAWLDSLVLRLGPDVLGLAPQSGAERLAAAAGRALARYESAEGDR